VRSGLATYAILLSPNSIARGTTIRGTGSAAARPRSPTIRAVLTYLVLQFSFLPSHGALKPNPALEWLDLPALGAEVAAGADTWVRNLTTKSDDRKPAS